MEKERTTQIGDQGLLLNIKSGEVVFFVHDSGSQAGDREIERTNIANCNVSRNYVNKELISVSYKNINRSMWLLDYTSYLQHRLGIEPF